MLFSKSFPFISQLDQMDCGSTCLKMIAKFYGKSVPISFLRENSYTGKQGTSMKGLSDAAEKIGFRTLIAKVDYEVLSTKGKFPCVAYWRQNHFVVIHKIKNNTVYVADPAEGLLTYPAEEFQKYWINTSQDQKGLGIIMFLEQSPAFFETEDAPEEKKDFSFLFQYLKPYQHYFGQMIIGVLASSLIALILPFLVQSLVDVGINNQDLNYIYVVIFAQLMLFLGSTSIELIRSWIRLHIASRISISLISDFLAKMMKLPMSFFDAKNVGDIRQRIADHHRIKEFITSSSLDTVFSLINLLIFSFVLFLYSSKIFFTFLAGSSLYLIWVLIFLKKRKILDYKRFNAMVSNQNNENYLIMGMQEIKLNNCEKEKRWEWESLQAKIFDISMKGLALEQYQLSGAKVIHELKNLLITLLAAQDVVNGTMTLGMMLATNSIIGQLNNPLLQLVSFVRQAQDAQISLDRLAEIHSQPTENHDIEDFELGNNNQDIILKNVCFRYGNPHQAYILNNISLTIPCGKITAIVGSSGSGKTTLLKLLLKFYEPESGEIILGNTNLNRIQSSRWREKCGAVMQDGFIFSDTIARNIAVTGETVDKERLYYAAESACIREMVDKLPLRYNTKIGGSGIGLSAGQKQRILIARLIYRNPDFLFFDEATSALDANNEKAIMHNLNQYQQNKTTVVIAHRLSTVKNADQIVVLHQGQIAEIGTHTNLVEKKGLYYQLVKNQLELGS